MQCIRSLTIVAKLQIVENINYESSKMTAQILLSPLAIEELIERILLSRRVTLGDRRQIRSAILAIHLTEAEHIMIDRLLYGVRKGLLQLEY